MNVFYFGVCESAYPDTVLDWCNYFALHSCFDFLCRAGISFKHSDNLPVQTCHYQPVGISWFWVENGGIVFFLSYNILIDSCLLVYAQHMFLERICAPRVFIRIPYCNTLLQYLYCNNIWLFMNASLFLHGPSVAVFLQFSAREFSVV